jgi:hypothetical protein
MLGEFILRPARTTDELSDGFLKAIQGRSAEDFLSFIQGLRNHLVTELPIQNSLIALDILNSVAMAYLWGESLSVKGLMGSLPHSSAGLRYHYARLMETGWIITVQDEVDARIRWVQPTDQLIMAYQSVLETYFTVI